MSLAEVVDAQNGIDWETDYIWVQDYGKLRLLDSHGRDGQVRLKTAIGGFVTLDRDIFAATYTETFQPAVYKPLFNPVKAHVLAEDTMLNLGGFEQPASAGDALISEPGAGIRLIPRDLYRSSFRALSPRRGGPKPTSEFP